MPPLTPPRYWRSLEDLADTPEFQAWTEKEFPSFLDEALTPASRRQFLKIMGASAALAGLTACRWPVDEIVPAAYRPEGVIPGVPEQYATAFELDGAALGLLVTSYDGRPIKVEGNPSHPASLGKTSARAQALILEMYDPDRSREVLRGGREIATFDDLAGFLADHWARLRQEGGRGFAVLARPGSSPALAELRGRLLAAYPQARWVEWAPVSRHAERAGTALVFGRPLRPVPRLDQARVIVSLDDDFLYEHPNAVRHAHDFAAGRRVAEGRINRLWVVESGYTVTGGNADRRVALPPSQIPTAAACLAAALTRKGVALPAALGTAVLPLASHPLAEQMAPIAADLAAAPGASVLLAGPGQPAEVHALVHALNVSLGNVDHAIAYVDAPDSGLSELDGLRALVQDMAAGRLDTLVMLGGNPVYDAPADLAFGEALAKVPTSVHLAQRVDETSRRSTWHVPQAHDLEAWGDARAWDGTYGVAQPLIEPLYGGKTALELLAALLGEPAARSHELVRRSFAAVTGSADDRRWRQALHDGLVEGTAWPAVSPAVASAGWVGPLLQPRPRPAEDQLEIVFRPSPGLYDGRFANNGWLMEMPEPLTKMTWGNAALVGPLTLEALQLRIGDRVRVRTAHGEAVLPVYPMPGQPPGTATVHLGYGRTSCGRVGDGVGTDLYPLRRSDALHATVASLTPTGERETLATTQDHHAIDQLGARERAERLPLLVREISFPDLQRGASVANPLEHGSEKEAGHPPTQEAPPPKPPQLYRSFEYAGHKWGMAIDLNACVGCNACTIACQAENNVPVVGRSEVANGREMHWIRVDRYFKGEPDNPTVVFQPVTCHHCENAPCEPVCPVAATLHDSEGLNVMVYNRCVGTRYCSNNCPYKVRRFNWFNNHKKQDPIAAMAYNPDVTVRGRGVMEKCTFCTQRIERVKIQAKNDRRPIRDGEIVPACAQACPAEAITFGDLNDESSAVRRQQTDGQRAYGMLEELNTRPRLRYLARVRNA
ncbi:MAG TPA: TAT-variant-translocated molybdopterin oxidoreductase [Candidatus Polarisedimenticolaceae bacterium]|nr:TAT-variant-translocated molybdopterin oxidoreductase [Candidatus Polarisedimenticolaceae bacterium]